MSEIRGPKGRISKIHDRGEGAIMIMLVLVGLAVAYWIFMGVFDYIQYVKAERGTQQIDESVQDSYGYSPEGYTSYSY